MKGAMMTSKVVDLKNLKQDWDETKIFGGVYGGFQRFDKYRHAPAKNLQELQEKSVWFPTDFTLTRDRLHFQNIPEGHRKAFRINLLFQTLADSIQTRGVEGVIAEACTDPSWEPVFRLWGFFESIHSGSYSHIVRSLYNDPSEFFDSIDEFPEIAGRFTPETELYNSPSGGSSRIDKLLMNVLLLEGVKFYVSFLTTYAINDHNSSPIGETANIIKLIQNDEAIHTSIVSNLLRIGRENPSELGVKSSDNWQTYIESIAKKVFDDEMAWFRYLKPHVDDIESLNETDVEGFIKHRIDKTLKAAGFEPIYKGEKNDLTRWFEDYSDINKQQGALQETGNTSYEIGTVKNDW